MIELIEPFPEMYWPLAWAWLDAARAQVADDFTPKTALEFVESYSRAFGQARTFGVLRDGQLGGVVVFEQASPVVAVVHVLFARRLWGRRTTAEAVLRACGRLFETTPTIKVLALIPAFNRLAIRGAARYGKIEGVLRHHTLRNGQPVDAVAVGLTKEEYGGIRTGRIDGRDEQLEHGQLEHHADVQPGPVSGSGPALQPDDHAAALGGQRVDVAERSGDDDGERGPDQPELLRDGRPDEQVPGGARVRTKRNHGHDSAQNGAGKAKRAGSKPGGRRRKPTRPR